MLLIAVVVERLSTDPRCWQGSLSAYYYTPVQSVFVGALITIGVCMVALRGQGDGEDVLMNLGGMLAPVVALVPTPHPGGCRSVGVAVNAAPENIKNNMTAFFIAGVIALVAGLITLLRQKRRTAWQIAGFAAAVLIFLGGVYWFREGRTGFDAYAHYSAAIPLFVCIVIVVFLNARRTWKWLYGTIGILMAISAGVLGVITWRTGWAHGILVIEVTLILLFAVFWVVQTVERWKKMPEQQQRTVRKWSRSSVMTPS
ncbi:hypothetical protein JCM33774_26380 [Actinophytocola sp. KF-1]